MTIIKVLDLEREVSAGTLTQTPLRLELIQNSEEFTNKNEDELTSPLSIREEPLSNEADGSDGDPSGNKNEEWSFFKKIQFKEYEAIKEKWKIQLLRTRRNAQDTTHYLKCKKNGCKVVYKTKVLHDMTDEHEMTIKTKFVHNHQMKDLEKIPQHGIKENVKDLIQPMILNKVKPHKIVKVLEEYKSQGKIEEKDMPTTSQVKNLKRNNSKKEHVYASEEDLQNVLDTFNAEEFQNDDDAIIIGQNLDPENFCIVFSSRALLKNTP